VSPSSIRTFALSALSGGLLAAAFPGTGDQGWLAFGALVPLLLVVGGVTWRRAAGLGFIAGLVFWLATIPWVASTMVRYGEVPWPLASLLLLALVGYLALYWGAFCALLSRCPLRSGGLYVIWAASLWVALEFLRTYLLTGFPTRPRLAAPLDHPGADPPWRVGVEPGEPGPLNLAASAAPAAHARRGKRLDLALSPA
jgi:apolipoprotein N-acyltransferase